MKLFDGGRAPNPRRVDIFLKEKGLVLETIPIDLNALEQKAEAFTQKNPMQRVPILELDDGTVIAESIAICRYLERIQPEPPLFGVGDVDEALVEMWQRRVELGLMVPIAMAFRHLHPGARVLEPVQFNDWGEANKPRAIEFMNILDTQLKDNAYVAGERFTVADISAIVALQFRKPARIEIPEELVHLIGWFSEMERRPSVVL